MALPIDLETVDYVANQTQEYIKRSPYASVILLNDAKLWQGIIEKACKSACRAKGLAFDCVDADVKGSKEILDRLEKIFRKHWVNNLDSSRPAYSHSLFFRFAYST